MPPPLTHVPWPPPRWYPPPRPDVQAVDRTPAPGNGGKHPQDPPADSGGCARCVTRGVSTIPPHKHVPTQARLQRRAGAGVVGARTGVMHGACVAVALSRWSPTTVGGSMQCCKCKGTVVVAGAGAVNARGLGQACVGAALPLGALQSLSRWPRRWWQRCGHPSRVYSALFGAHTHHFQFIMSWARCGSGHEMGARTGQGDGTSDTCAAHRCTAPPHVRPMLLSACVYGVPIHSCAACTQWQCAVLWCRHTPLDRCMGGRGTAQTHQ